MLQQNNICKTHINSNTLQVIKYSLITQHKVTIIHYQILSLNENELLHYTQEAGNIVSYTRERRYLLGNFRVNGKAFS